MRIDLVIRREWPRRQTDTSIVEVSFPNSFMLPRRLSLSAMRLEPGRWLVEHCSYRWWNSPHMPVTLTHENGIYNHDDKFYGYRWVRRSIIVTPDWRSFPFLHDVRILARSHCHNEQRYRLDDISTSYSDVLYLHANETGLDAAPAGTASPKGGPMVRKACQSMVQHAERKMKEHSDKVAAEINDKVQEAAGMKRHPFGKHWVTPAEVAQYMEDIRIAAQNREAQQPRY